MANTSKTNNTKKSSKISTTAKTEKVKTTATTADLVDSVGTNIEDNGENKTQAEILYADLKEKFEAQSKQIEMLTQALLLKTAENKSNNIVEEGLIHPNKKTKITSLTAGLMTLHCRTYGFLRFENFGSQQIVTYQVLSEYVQSDRNFAENGYYYIHDQQMVEELGLTEYYKKIFDNTIVNKILNENIETYIDLIKNTNENQKASLISILIREIKENRLTDYIKIKKLSDVLKTDLSKQVEEIQQFDKDFTEQGEDTDNKK